MPGQVIDVLVSEKRDLAATRRFFTRAPEHGPSPSEVTTDGAAAYPRVLDELVPAACHITEQYTNNPVEADHGRLKARLWPMRGLKQLRSARVISTGHAFIQNLRRGHYELGVDADSSHRLRPPSPNLPLPSDHGTTAVSLVSFRQRNSAALLPAGWKNEFMRMIYSAMSSTRIELSSLIKKMVSRPCCQPTGSSRSLSLDRASNRMPLYW